MRYLNHLLNTICSAAVFNIKVSITFVYVLCSKPARRMRTDRAAVEHIAGRKGAYARRA